MGEVYRAEDTRLGREVAIKVLPEAVAADPERLARFEREAKVLASLNHPNIAGIHQIEEAGGQQLLVMELVEGEDLAARMAQGPVAIDQTVDIAQQIALGLEAAHERGIVHRDLKPANIKLTPEAQVKVLDFGLAKALDPGTVTGTDQDRNQSPMSLSPTLTAQMTQAGVILGTAAYMSPEQARGQEADPRADIWALGVIVYEMLTGRRLFGESTVSDTLAAVLRADIDWDALPSTTPRSLSRVLRKSLTRDPKQRYHAAADVRIDLKEVVDGEADAPMEGGEATAAPRRLPWIIAASALALAAVLAVTNLGSGEKESATAAGTRTVASLLPPAEADFFLDRFGLSFSPDGKRLAFVARGEDRETAIWVQTLSREIAEKIPGTDGAVAPFWSPDSRSLGFAQDGTLKTLELESGLVETLGPQLFPNGATWSPSGDIVFALDSEALPLQALKRTGGKPRPVTEIPGAGDHYFGPEMLPDGEHFIFHARRYSSDEQVGQIRLGSLDGSPSKALFEAYSTARFVEPGYIVWWQQGNLRARGFDPDRLELSGEPFAIASNVRFDPRSAFAVAAISNTGRLVYQPGGRVAGNRLIWYGRGGEELGTVGPAGSLYQARISPDGSRIVLDISGDSNQGDIWVLDAERGSGTRVTTWPEDDSYPVWSPDGRALMFSSTRGGGQFRIFQVGLEGASEAELVLDEPDVEMLVRAWAADGSRVLFRRGVDPSNIWALDVATGETFPVIESAFDSNDFAISPDGAWLAYDSNETGDFEVYLTSFPDAGQRIRVSTDGGAGPVWSADGRELFFSSPDSDAIFGVSVEVEGSQPRPGKPERLFGVDMRVHSTRQFDTLDGERFLVNTNVNSGARTPLKLVLNWAEGL